MRNRHIPRLCRNCQAPMARHQDACWRCGAQWASEEAWTTLRLVAAAAPGQPEHVPERRIALEPAARTTSQMSLDVERETNEGGSFASEVAAAVASVSARG
jgi:predicted amidophosphoribosyltransferase